MKKGKQKKDLQTKEKIAELETKLAELERPSTIIFMDPQDEHAFANDLHEKKKKIKGEIEELEKSLKKVA